jgi:hypothetical protein
MVNLTSFTRHFAAPIISNCVLSENDLESSIFICSGHSDVMDDEFSHRLCKLDNLSHTYGNRTNYGDSGLPTNFKTKESK